MGLTQDILRADEIDGGFKVGAEKLEKIQYMILDVDGVLTDTGLYFDNTGNEFKKFSTYDYAGVFAAHYIGWKVLILTGRECLAMERRAKEMKIDELYQNAKNKVQFIKSFMSERGIDNSNLAYIGDDLNDYGAMKTFAGFKACPANACPEIKAIADYVSTFKGGTGVVQDVMRYVLNQLGKWDEFISNEVEAGY